MVRPLFITLISLTLDTHAHEGTVVCLFVCYVPLYCLCTMCMQQNKHTSQVCAELQRFSTDGFR